MYSKGALICGFEANNIMLSLHIFGLCSVDEGTFEFYFEWHQVGPT